MEQVSEHGHGVSASKSQKIVEKCVVKNGKNKNVEWGAELIK